ncbi:MAG: hypothetical protein LC135_12860 [Phycisphaerae bacterium]|nr:hypothetical protein [Phycisphaerae bacterium]MCZ2400742.1 hypothetical protein [Phycisphaerae bacterium]NUQ48386.1 hypothetical protein [Phycisphaerae bacterium]
MPTFSRKSRSSAWRRNSTRRYSTSRTTTSSSPIQYYSPTKFTTCRRTIEAKIGSYRALNQQFGGKGYVAGFSPAAANKWIRFVNSGACVYSFSNNEFTRTFGRTCAMSTPNNAFRILRNRFGAGIKAVTRGKASTWLIAASPSVTARPFSNYNWK